MGSLLKSHYATIWRKKGTAEMGQTAHGHMGSKNLMTGRPWHSGTTKKKGKREEAKEAGVDGPQRQGKTMMSRQKTIP